jgi:hypothetical protein
MAAGGVKGWRIRLSSPERVSEEKETAGLMRVKAKTNKTVNVPRLLLKIMLQGLPQAKEKSVIVKALKNLGAGLIYED